MDLDEHKKTEADASSYVVSHIFKTGNAALDKSRIYIELNAAQTFTKKKKGADSVEIVLSDPNKTVNLQLKLFERLPAYYVVQTWKEKSEKVLSAMALQDKALFIILAVLISISMLNIISGLVTLVSSKASDIGILRTMGVRRSSVKRIFFLVRRSDRDCRITFRGNPRCNFLHELGWGFVLD